jgi:hypothetical protein
MAGFELSVKSDIKNITKHLTKVQRKIIPPAIVSALNKTGTTVNKEAIKQVREETRLPVKRIRSKLKIARSRRGVFRWSLKGIRAATNIIEWVTAKKKHPGAFSRAKGVKSRAWGKTKAYPETFIGYGKNSGKLLVYKLSNKTPSGVASVQGPSVRAAFANAVNGLKPLANRRFITLFEHEIKFRLGRLNKR